MSPAIEPPRDPAPRSAALRLCSAGLVGMLLLGCDQVNQRLGIEDPAKKESRQDAEGRAVGSGCRQSGRAIEDCYAIYQWLPKASIFAGWREMNDYMLANKLDTVQPRLEPPGSQDEGKRRKRRPADADAAAEPEKAAETPAAKGKDADKPAAESAGVKPPAKP